MITAGGTVSPQTLTWPWRLFRLVEMTVLFVAAPIVLHRIVQGERIPIFAALVPVLLFAIVMLIVDPTFQLRRELTRRISWRNGLSIAVVFTLAGGFATWWVKTHHPDWFLEFPTNRPETYKRIMVLYPLFSVAAQELVYRTFYFHRYGPVFGEQAWLAVVVNGILFGFAHIVVASEFAIVATALGGLILAARYAQTRSFWGVFVEHTIWGWLIFTIGLGRYFFTGVQNPGW
jgi:membrane protease YdiL (CAAX protease family)